MTPEEQRDIIEFRILSLQAQLQYMQDSDVQKFLVAFDTAIAKIESDLVKAIEATEKRARLVDLLDNALAMYNTVAVRAGEAIIDRAATMAAYSAEKTQDIVSWDGKVPGFNNVAMPASAYAEIIRDQEFGGKNILEWVSGLFESLGEDATDKERNIREKDIADFIENSKIAPDIQAAIIRGKNPRVAALQFANKLGYKDDASKRHLETIYRTYTQTAAAKASEAVYKANKDVVTEMEWNAVLEMPVLSSGMSGTCVRCLGLDGTVYKLDEPTPPMPLHPRCVHPETSIFAPDKIAAFVTTYNGPVIEFTLSDDRRFTVSVNHMFATKNGLVKAGSLCKGDYIVNTAFTDAFINDPDDDRYPASIEDQVKAFAKSPGVVTVRVPASPEYLHGDSEFGDGYVDIITFDSLLRGDFKTFFNEFFGDKGFILGSNLGFSLHSLGTFLFELWGLSFSFGCDVGGFGIPSMLFRSTMLHHVSVGFNDSTDMDVVFNQNFSDFISGNIESFCDSIFGNHVEIWDNYLTWIKDRGISIGPGKFESGTDSIVTKPGNFADILHGFSGPSEFVKIKDLRTFDYSGHLYDLHCFSGLYYISGVLTSNCRCAWIPVLKTWKELGIDAEEIPDGERKVYEAILEQGKVVGRESNLENIDAGSWFNQKDLDEIQKAIGKTRGKLVHDGYIELEDNVIKNKKDKTTYGTKYKLGDLILLKDLPKGHPGIDVTIIRNKEKS